MKGIESWLASPGPRWEMVRNARDAVFRAWSLFKPETSEGSLNDRRSRVLCQIYVLMRGSTIVRKRMKR